MFTLLLIKLRKFTLYIFPISKVFVHNRGLNSQHQISCFLFFSGLPPTQRRQHWLHPPPGAPRVERSPQCWGWCPPTGSCNLCQRWAWEHVVMEGAEIVIWNSKLLCNFKTPWERSCERENKFVLKGCVSCFLLRRIGPPTTLNVPSYCPHRQNAKSVLKTLSITWVQLEYKVTAPSNHTRICLFVPQSATLTIYRGHIEYLLKLQRAQLLGGGLRVR